MTLNDFIIFERKWEGGLSRHTFDSASKTPCPTPFKGKSGWHTNAGITYSVWRKKFGKTNDQRFFAMSNEDWFAVFDSLYYSKVKAGSFNSLSIGFMVTTIAWGSGARQAGLTLNALSLRPSRSLSGASFAIRRTMISLSNKLA